MSKGIDELKDWAMHNVKLISILPSNKNLSVDTKLVDVLEEDVDEKYYIDQEKVEKLILKDVGDLSGVVPVLTPERLNKSQNGRRFKTDGEPMFTLTAQDRHGIAVREATKKGYAVAEHGDSVNVAYPESQTRRGRVGKQTANTLLTGEEQAVVLGGVYTNDSIEFHRGPLEGLSRTLKSNNHDAGVMVKQVEEITNKTRPNEEIGITIKENGDIRPHRMDKRKSGISELNINHENNASHTVTASHSPKIYGDSTNYRIRKLTPLECWRLQGFTDEQFYKAKNDGVSNSQLYKQAGNSVTVNVIDAIARKLL